MKKSVSKWIALLLSVVMIVMCAAGCSKTQTQETATDDTTDAPAQTADTPAQADEPEQADAPEQAEPVTITFWHTYGDSEEAQFLNVVMPLWETLHPEIKVEAVRQDSSQYHQMIVTSFGTGMSPDVARVDIANIAAYAKQGGLAALSDYPDFAELSASYLDAPLSTNLYQGKYYGLPLDTNCKAAVVNTNVLKELGLDEIPATMEEFIEAAKTRGTYSLNVSGVGDWDMYPYFWLFGGVLNAFELMKSMIEAGAAAVHFEDQLASVKKCGHMGGKVLVPTQEAIQKLVAARLAADVLGVPTLVIARTDADAADLITSDCDPYDSEFITGERTSEGFYRTHAGIEQAISRGLAYAPYADLVWCETSTPDLALAKRFADAIHAKYPGKLLAYNCSPSFNWQKNLDDTTIASFQQQLSDMGYKYQFITLAGIHSMWFNMFDLAHAYAQGEGMKHYVEKVQQPEFAAGKEGYTFVSHQQEVGTGYFDNVTTIIQGGASSVTALTGSTEEAQF